MMVDIDIKKKMENNLQHFKDRVLPIEWLPRSILLSEAFAFCSLSGALGVDLLIESGMYNGRSTQVWGKYFESQVLIKTVDLSINNDVIQRLGNYSNIEFIEGDGVEIVSDLVSSNPNCRIALFLDGPKGVKAIELAKKCFQFDNVLIAGIHDLHKMTVQGENKNRIVMEQWDKTALFTDEQWFVDKYSFLDENESNYDHDQKMKWTPYEMEMDGCNNKKLGSYGPTLGLALNG